MSGDGFRVRRQRRKVDYAQVPDRLIRDLRVTAEALRMWCLIDRYLGDNDSAWPFQETMAKELGRSVPSLQRDGRNLRETGWLVVRRRVEKGRLAGNEYVLMEDPDLPIDDDPSTVIRETSTVMARDPNESQVERENTPPTPLSEGGAAEVIEGTIEDGDPTTTDPLRGHRGSAKLTRRGGAPTEQERAVAAEVFEAWVQSPEILGRPRRSGAVLTGDRVEVIVHRLRDGYGVDDLADACRGWTRIPHNRGENERGTRYDSLALLLRDAEHVDRFRDAWRDQHDPADGVRQAALMRQATRNPMLAAAAAVAPAGMGHDPERDLDVREALDDALRQRREDDLRAGRPASLRLPDDERERVIEEALAARAVPC